MRHVMWGEIMRVLLSFLALSLALSCSASQFGAMKSSASGSGTGDGDLTQEVKEAIDPKNVANNEPPTLILDPNDIDTLGLDLNSYLAKREWTWDANPTSPIKVTDSAVFKDIAIQSVNISRSDRQVTRQRYTKTVRQEGQDASSNTMTFKSQAAGILDVLLVIDSSGSMGDEQSIVKNNLPNLLSHIGDSDWRIAVTNTEPTCAFKAPISKNTPNYQTKYRNMIDVGLAGGTEYAVYNAKRSIMGQCSNSRWLRSNSNIAVIIVTDEPHQCPNSAQCGAYKSKVLRKYLNAAISPRDPSDLTVYGLTALRQGWEASDLFDMHGNVKNKNKYDEMFDDISEDIQSVLKKSFTLDHTPDQITSVTVGGNAKSSSDYTLNGRIITFNDGVLPEENDVDIVVSYTHGFRSFTYDTTLDHVPLAGRTTVTINGVNSNAFTLSGKQLSFNGCSANACSSFPAGATANINYQQNIALKSKLVLAGSSTHNIKMDTLVVRVGSAVKSRPADYTLQTESNGDKAIVFTSPPPEGETMEVSYTNIIKLSYAHRLHPSNTSNSITCKDYHNRSRIVSCSYANGSVTFPVTIDTNKVVVHEELTASEFSLDHTLGDDYIAASIEVKCTLGNGSANNLTHTVSAGVLSIDATAYNSCVANAQSQNTSYVASIAYKVREIDQDNFFIDYSFFSDHAGKYKFIYVVAEVDSDGDGLFSKVSLKEFKFDFTYGSAEDAKLEFLNTLPPDTAVKVTVYLLTY